MRMQERERRGKYGVGNECMLEGAKEKARKDECVKEKVEKRMGGKRYAT